MISVTLHELIDAGPRQTALVSQSCQLLQTALNDPNFVPMVANATYRETRFRDANGQTRSIPPAELPGFIASGAERGTPGDNEIDLKIKLARLRRGVVGSTIPGRLPFRTAYWFINGCLAEEDAISPARHFIHEWLHVAGFYHYPNNSAREDVPYVVGDIIRQLLSQNKALHESTAMAQALDQADCGADGASAEEEAGPEDAPI